MIENVKNTLYSWFHRSEKILKIDLTYLAKGGFWLSIGQFFSSLSAFILSILFANLLDQETYGIYKYTLSVFPILSIFTLAGMSTSATQAVARGYDGQISRSLNKRVTWGILGSVFSLSISVYYYINGETTLATAFCLTSLFVPIMDTFGIYDSLLQGKRMFSTSISYFIASQIIAFLTMAATLTLTNNIILILLAYFLPWTLTRMLFYRQIVRRYKENDAVDPASDSYGIHLSIMGTLGTIAGFFDRVILFNLTGAAALAQYSIAIAPVDQLRSLLVRGASTLSFPKFAAKDTESIKKSLKQHTGKFVLVTVTAAVFYIAMANLLFKIFFPTYHAAIPFSMAYALTLIPLGSTLSYTALSAKAAKDKLYIFNVLSSLFQIGSLALGIWLWGVWGLVGARVVSRFFDAGLTFYLMRKF